MKVAFLFGPWSIGTRPLNFFADNIWVSTRGLTGSELGIIATAKEFVQMGHDVSLFTVHVPGTRPAVWEGIKLYDFESSGAIIDDTFDALISWSEPDILRSFSSKPVRVVCEMLNDFTFVAPGFDQFVDIWTAPSDRLKEHLLQQDTSLPRAKWHVVPLGCDPTIYSTKGKIKNRVVSISSPDRGLHLFLQQWPLIKKAVPDASLQVFYHMGDGTLETIEPRESFRHPNVLELAQRTRYIRNALKKLESLDVSYVGSSSRVTVADMLSKAEVAVAPLSTVSFSEGFSVATLETLAAGCFPLIGDIDCLGSIYGETIPMVPGPVEQHLDELTAMAVRSLQDEEWRTQVVERGKKLAHQLTWTNSARILESIITKHSKFGTSTATPDVNVVPSVKLNIAAGPNIFPFPGWINYDHEDLSEYFNYIQRAPIDSMPMQHQKNLAAYLRTGAKIEYRARDLTTGFPEHANNSVDLIYFGQAIEHCNPLYQVPQFLKECHRMLKLGGVLRITTPDFELLLQAYLNHEMDKFAEEQPEFYKQYDPISKLAFIMYASCGPQSSFSRYEGHHFIFSKTSMRRFLQEAGFNDIVFYSESGESRSAIMAKECVDAGISHSLICEAIK